MAIGQRPVPLRNDLITQLCSMRLIHAVLTEYVSQAIIPSSFEHWRDVASQSVLAFEEVNDVLISERFYNLSAPSCFQVLRKALPELWQLWLSDLVSQSWDQRVEVTGKCVGAMTCRVLAPEIFHEVRTKSQPAFRGSFTEAGKEIRSEEEYHAVRRAVYSCPFKAIRWTRQPRKRPSTSSFVYEGYPKQVEGDVYYMGLSDKTTFGSAGFLIRCAGGQNVLIDPPIAHPKLVEALSRMGGVQHLLFTHVDHTANHGAWHEATKARRLMHRADVVRTHSDYSPFPVTSDFETLLELRPFETVCLDGVPDLQIIATPGHTPGSIMFLYKDRFLFTGDSLAFSPAKGHLHAHRIQTFQSWKLQEQSLQKLLSYDFCWVLPGHGDWKKYETASEARQDLRKCLAWMLQQASGKTWLPRYVLWTLVRPKIGGPRQLLLDSLILPQGAKDHFPNWTLPSWLLSAAVVLPCACFLALRLHRR
ncbi:unnamed protein product [Symbiodinium natans]|uniref:Metallo-beta-lactamase domain-containing protein n=1 Tax=Symbiodinium natans TaxID=878477 RepID=A0A812JEK1_9DINO|nr:unnamed protein product [Symbiodinium natans]